MKDFRHTGKGFSEDKNDTVHEDAGIVSEKDRRRAKLERDRKRRRDKFGDDDYSDRASRRR